MQPVVVLMLAAEERSPVLLPQVVPLAAVVSAVQRVQAVLLEPVP